LFKWWEALGPRATGTPAVFELQDKAFGDLTVRWLAKSSKDYRAEVMPNQP